MHLIVVASDVVEISGSGGVKNGIKRVISGITDWSWWQARILIGVVGRINFEVGFGDWLPISFRMGNATVANILNGGINLKSHINFEAIH